MRNRGRANKRDANEREIVFALMDIGCSISFLDDPADLLVGYKAKNFLLEVKSKTGTQSQEQKDFCATWNGQYRIVRTADEAIKVVTESYEQT